MTTKPKAPKSEPASDTTSPDDPPRVDIKFVVPHALAERFRNAVDACSGPPLRLRVNAAGIAALEAFTADLEGQNHGKPFPQRPPKADR